jgi:hypothetical protein
MCVPERKYLAGDMDENFQSTNKRGVLNCKLLGTDALSTKRERKEGLLT